MDLSPHRYLLETDWLYKRLGHPDLRIVEATSLIPNYFDETSDNILKRESGRGLWAEGHIPGSVYVDILKDLSDSKGGRFMYGMPSTEQFVRVMSSLGVGGGTAVVIYDRGMNIWAARLWWMLRAFGFTNAAVLNGGYTKWLAETKPIDTKAETYPPAQFKPQRQPELISDRERVLAATEDELACLINALDANEFNGLPPQRYARAGRIPSSVNVPFAKTADPESQLFADDKELRTLFDDVGAANAKEIICYCGGGIAACSTALALLRLGFDNVSVYDGSLTEWAADPRLPLETQQT